MKPATARIALTVEETSQYEKLLDAVSRADSRGVDDLIGSIEASRIPVVLNAFGSGQSETLLHRAVLLRSSEKKESALKIIEALITAGANPNLLGKSPPDKPLQTPLHMAAALNDVATVEAILRAKTVDVNTLDENNLTALSSATQAGNVEIVKKLLEAGAKISIPDTQGCTSLHIATLECHVKVLEKLLERSNEAREFLLKSTELTKVIGEIKDARQKSEEVTAALKSKARALTSEMKALSQKTGEFEKEFCVDVKNNAGKTALEIAQGVLGSIMSGTRTNHTQTIAKILKIGNMLEAAGGVTKPALHSAAAGASTKGPIELVAARKPLAAALLSKVVKKHPNKDPIMNAAEGEIARNERWTAKADAAALEVEADLLKEENAAKAKREAELKLKRDGASRTAEAPAKAAEKQGTSGYAPKYYPQSRGRFSSIEEIKARAAKSSAPLQVEPRQSEKAAGPGASPTARASTLRAVTPSSKEISR